jgi:hypothetical protein
MNTPTGTQKESVLDIGSRLELFVDRYLIDTMTGAQLKLHHPTRQNVALCFDAPWEGTSSTYVTVMEVEGQYRMYYRGSENVGQVACCAESEDAIHWTRPDLGLYEVAGTRENNVVLDTSFDRAAHNFAPFLDPRPGVPSDERFKGVGSSRLDGKPVLAAFVSADGYRWRPLREEPILTDGAFDSQNLAYWDALRGHYVAFYRQFKKGNELYHGVRTVKWATSPDFRTWTPGQQLDYGDVPLEHFYTNATVSYFRAPHIYLALPKRFLPKRQAVPEHPSPGVSDGVFMTSRDGLHWDRTFMEAFLRPGRDRENWTQRGNMIAWGIVPTAPDAISIYWTEHYMHPTCRVRRGTLRTDGFVSVNAPYAGGELVTHPLRFEGSELVINYATSAAGSVRVEIQDAKGQPLPGYELAESVELYGDEIEQVVAWKGGSDVGRLAGEGVRLRFVMKDADLYAIRFR